MMKILLVGATSALATALAPALSAVAELTTAGRRDADLHLDLADAPEAIVVPDGTDVVVQVAAHFGGQGDAEFLAAHAINVLGTAKLCQAAVKANAKHFVLISSMSASLTGESPYFGAYALSKRQSEEVAQLYCGLRALPLAILRPSQLYGNHDSFRRHQPFIYVMADSAASKQEISIFGSHDALRNYLHADDFAAMIVRVIQQRIEGTYACLYPSDLAYSQVARAAFRAFGHDGVVRFRDDKPDIPDNVFPHDGRLDQLIGFTPQISIDEGMKQLARLRQRT